MFKPSWLATIYFQEQMACVLSLLCDSNSDPTACQEHGHYQYNKPFEHPAIIATLRDDLFSSSYPITHEYSYRFLPGKEEEYMLEPSMVALAATAVRLFIHFLSDAWVPPQVYALLKEWEAGTRVSIPFSMSVYDSVYCSHLSHLETIQEKHEKAYKSMMRRLFCLSLCVILLSCYYQTKSFFQVTWRWCHGSPSSRTFPYGRHQHACWRMTGVILPSSSDCLSVTCSVL